MRKRNITPERKGKSAYKQWKTAKKLEDNAMLISALIFYVKRLQPGVETSAEPIEEFYRWERPRKWRPYLLAARRWLGIQYPTRDTLVLPDDWFWRLIYCGQNTWELDPVERAKFQALNADLEVDDEVISFSEAHPEMLERCKIYLEQNYSPTLKEMLGKKEAADEEERLRAEYDEAQRKAQFWVDIPEEEPAQTPFNALEFMKGNIKTHLKQAETMMPWDPRLSRAHR
jgi:hypothetical protein